MGKFMELIKGCLGRAPPTPPPRRRKDSFKYFTTDFSVNPASRWAVAVFQTVVDSASAPDVNIVISPNLAEIILTRLLLGPNSTLKSTLLEAVYNNRGEFSEIPKDGESATTFGSFECFNVAFSDDRCCSSSRPEKTIQCSVNAGLVKEPADESFAEGPATLNRICGGKIDGKSVFSLVHIMRETRRILINPAEFSCRWDFAFDETKSGTFYCPNNVEKTVEFLMNMTAICNKFNTHPGSDGSEANDPKMIIFHANRGKFSIMLLLPATIDHHISSLENALTIEKLLEWRRKSDGNLAHVIVPKLRINTGCGFAPGNEITLSTTDSAAKFEDRPLECASQSKIILNMDENGINATQAPYRNLQYDLLLHQPEFVANRPFLLIIWDEMVNVPVFIGRITDPTGAATQMPLPCFDCLPQSGVQNQ
ncbi:factor XIIa inhibitor-like [Paramacrobiotus metropolitanus]|uniref:factor XIIa inhibitor-like n=1 Tax=Paramacrobiotus metropolitanus TaxID=2943436 RepID=UPI002445A5B4|nr:factor XIIa inhibitor-like [Paramacrobiotus metropolitanus]